jgi:plastocyanin
MYKTPASHSRSGSSRGRMGRLNVVAFAIVCLIVGGALALPVDPPHGPGSGLAPTAVTGSITVAATKDYGYQPDTFQQVPTNATITVTFTDDDVLQHTFNISSREGFVIPTSYTAAQLDHLFGTYPSLFSATVNGPGDQYVGSFRSPATPGWYEFVCNVTGHFQNGMYGFIAFGENLPSNLTPPSRVGVGGGGISTIDGAIIVVVVLGVILGFVLLRRRRSRSRAPPGRVERP